MNRNKGYSQKGGNTMVRALFHESNAYLKKVLGFKDLRNSLSAVIDKSINSYTEIICGNVKKNDNNTVSIISTKILDEILSAYKFNAIINFDEETNQYEVILNEIGIYGVGDTRQEAMECLIDLVKDSTSEFFENLELYMRIPDLAKKYPYYLRISHSNSSEDLMKVLNFV